MVATLLHAMDWWMPSPDWSGNDWSGSNGYGQPVFVWLMSMTSIIVGGGSW